MTTDDGVIDCEHVVCASGNFARKTGAMVGLDIPVIPVQHQYLVTEPHPDIMARKEKGLPEMGVLRESDSSWYLREENGGLILGPYEHGAPCCYVDGPDENSEYELFEADLDRLEPHIEESSPTAYLSVSNGHRHREIRLPFLIRRECSESHESNTYNAVTAHEIFPVVQ